MKNTSLCYLEKDGQYLMLLRNKKKKDENAGKWIGVGGHFLEGESPEECAKREVKEETGLEVHSLRFRGIVTFCSNVYETEYMHLFTSEDFSGEMIDCNEGTLSWIPIEQVENLSLWEGDRVFLPLLRSSAPFFSLKLTYEDEKMVSAFLDGKEVLRPF